MRIEVIAQLDVSVEIQILGVVFFIKQNARRVDMRGRSVLHPIPVFVGSCWERRVLACSGVEQHLRVEDVMVLER